MVLLLEQILAELKKLNAGIEGKQHGILTMH
jgi:hypothetical protein